MNSGKTSLRVLIEKAEETLEKIESYALSRFHLKGQIASEIKSIHTQGKFILKKIDKPTLEEYSNLFSEPPENFYKWDNWLDYNLCEFEKCIGILKAIEEYGPENVIDKSETKVFISHGKFGPEFKNLETFIRAIGCLPIYDINEPTEAKTINKHVASLMEKSDFYIILASHETTNVSGKKLPNNNVIIEYDRLVQSKTDEMIVLLEEDCVMPSMLQELIYVPFSKNCMDLAFIKIAVELKNLDLL